MVLEQNSKNFDNFYSKSSLKPLLDRNYLIFKYFKKEKMRENGGEDIYLSIEKTFNVMENYHLFLNKKKILQQNLNLSLRKIQEICSKRITIQNDLENNKISNFLDIRKEMESCETLLNESLELTNKHFDESNNFLLPDDKIKLSQILPSSVETIQFDFKMGRIKELDDLIKKKNSICPDRNKFF